MHLSELLQEDLVKTSLDAATKWEAIEELVDLLISAHELRLNDRAAVLEAVATREKSMSTGLARGLAVPHGAADCVREVVASLGISRSGIPFDSADGKPAKLIVLLVIPADSFQRHVGTLAGIARLARNEDLRNRIYAAQSAAEVMDVIFELEARQGPQEPQEPGEQPPEEPQLT
ncbi:MAG: PTS sugar transporter subunit IIA [Spirochaetia bacterium]|jgi:mannitol/fructose-specific phosphotransferase system IIA component (Ntr-type)